MWPKWPMLVIVISEGGFLGGREKKEEGGVFGKMGRRIFGKMRGRDILENIGNSKGREDRKIFLFLLTHLHHPTRDLAGHRKIYQPREGVQ